MNKAAYPRLSRMRGQLACPVLRGARVSNDPRLLDKAASIKRTPTGVRFCGKSFRVFEREKLAQLPVPPPVITKGGKTRQPMPWLDGCFAQDAVGDWWLCVPVEVKVEQTAGKIEAVGIDLGLKDTMTASDGWRLPHLRFGRKAEEKLARLQRYGAPRKELARAHRKVARQHRDYSHKASTKVVKRYDKIAVGDVSSSKLVKTRMAKSVLDACWGQIKTQLQYKCQQAGRAFVVIDERFTTQTCSSCGARTGPAGLDMLVVRTWLCSRCGIEHDRDINAGKVILVRAQVSGWKRPGDSERERGVRERKPGVCSRSASRRARHLADARQGGDARSGAP